MIPSLIYPLALFGLASLPALAAIYIFRNRYRRRQVSSLVLWRFAAQSKSGGARIHKLQLPLLFFIELVALLLLVTAATGPRWKLPQSGRPLIIVLNDSFSMRAISAGVSARDRAGDFLEQLFRRQTPPSTRLILAGVEPRVTGSTARNWRELEQGLSQWKCREPAAAIDPAITLAVELGRQQANILVLTDHKPADEKISSRRLEWHAFGKPLDNDAIVNASRTAFGTEDRCLLEIANFSPRAHTVRLLTQTGSNAPQITLLAIDARASQRVVFNVPSSAPSLHATLEPDALADDNSVELLPPIRKRVRVQVALTNESLAELVNRTLDATGLRATLAANPDIVVQEADTPAAAGENAWVLHLTTRAATNACTGPFILDTSHPLANGLALDGAVWAAAAATNAPGDVPVILAGNTPLLSARQDPTGRHHVTLNLDPALSTVQNTPDWPVLFWNLLSWRISEMPGLKQSNARLGTEVVVKTTGVPLTVIQPDGAKKLFPKPGAELALETPMKGVYTLVTERSTNQFSVNALAADESDLSACASGQWGKWSEDTEWRLEETPAIWIFGLLSLGVLTAHLCLASGAKGGG